MGLQASLQCKQKLSVCKRHTEHLGECFCKGHNTPGSQGAPMRQLCLENVTAPKMRTYHLKTL